MKFFRRYLLTQGMLAMIACGSLYHFVGTSAQAAQIVNRVAATVNGRPITSNEVRARLDPYLRELIMLYPKQGPRFNAELVKAKKAVINELIERELKLMVCEVNEPSGVVLALEDPCWAIRILPFTNTHSVPQASHTLSGICAARAIMLHGS